MVLSLEINWNSQKIDEVKKIKFWLNKDKVLIWEMWAWFTGRFAVKRTLSSLVTSTTPCGLSRKLCHEEHFNELEKCLHRSVHALLLQKTPVEFPVTISSYSQPSVIPVPIDLMPSLPSTDKAYVEHVQKKKHKHLNKNKIRTTFQFFLATVDKTI